MMRYYLCPTIGTGSDSDPCRPKVDIYTHNWAAAYEKPNEQNSIVIAEASDFAEIDADPEITLLSDSIEEAVTDEEFQRICPSGRVMIYG